MRNGPWDFSSMGVGLPLLGEWLGFSGICIAQNRWDSRRLRNCVSSMP